MLTFIEFISPHLYFKMYIDKNDIYIYDFDILYFYIICIQIYTYMYVYV